MTTTAISFFSSEENRAVIRSFAAVLRTIPPLDSPQPDVVQTLSQFIGILAAHPEVFDEHCTANIGWLGQRYIGQISSFIEERGERMDARLVDIFTTSYRFLCELELSQPGDLSFELRAMKNFVEDNLEAFQGTQRQQLIYANYTMPANIVKRLIHDSSLGDFKAFATTASEAKSMKEEWDKELAEKNAEVQGLREAIDKVRTQYNFVGLVRGFENLADTKRNERLWSFISLLGLGGIMLFLICGQLLYLFQEFPKIESHRAILVYSLPATLALELLLLYFFRIILFNFKSAQTQLMQLSLRISLCQFIQSYAEYSAKIKKSDPLALDRFEAVVFSSIISDEGKLPATFDGIEQLAKLVKSVRS